MKKVKQVIQENKILLVLGAILIVCLLVCAIVAITYFYGSSDNAYGNRLDTIKGMELNKKLFQDIEDELTSNTSVKSASATLKGKIVYINILYNAETSMDDAKKIAEGTLALFNDDELMVYDLQFTIAVDTKEDNGYTLMGARNASGIGEVVWNNYNIEEESVEE